MVGSGAGRAAQPGRPGGAGWDDPGRGRAGVQGPTLKPAVLVLDEVGYLRLARPDANMVFQLTARRYERGSILLTSNKAFSEWAASSATTCSPGYLGPVAVPAGKPILARGPHRRTHPLSGSRADVVSGTGSHVGSRQGRVTPGHHLHIEGLSRSLSR
jgi:hypothetical protein